MCDVYTDYGCAGSTTTTGGGALTNWYNNGEGWGDPQSHSTNRQLMPAALKQALADLAKHGCDVGFTSGIAKGHGPG